MDIVNEGVLGTILEDIILVIATHGLVQTLLRSQLIADPFAPCDFIQLSLLICKSPALVTLVLQIVSMIL